MANYFNLTLDTTAPGGVSVKINGDEIKTASTAVVLTIGCSDADTTGYQMKIWGTASAQTEAQATWETFTATKNVTLPSSDGVKTVYVRIRDDVWNESTVASDTIQLSTSVPTITTFTISPAKISTVDGKDMSSGTIGFSEDIDAFKIMIVSDINSPHNAATNISIPTTNGSCASDDNSSVSFGTATLEAEVNLQSSLFIDFVLKGADIAAVSPGDGVKIIKAFVRSAASGLWSI